MKSRCRRCWLWWAVAGVAIELRGYHRRCHPTLSRDTKALLCRVFGRRGPWAAFLAGAWFSWHLSRLPELLTPEVPHGQQDILA